MAELIDKNHVLPHRIFALVAAVHKCPNIARTDLIRLVQPESINESVETSGNIFAKSQLCGLITISEDKQRTATLAVDPIVATNLEAFREYMQSTVLGITQEDQDHFILNVFAAWIAVQNEWIINTSKPDWEMKFNQEMYPGLTERVLSEHPGITTWMEWANFLGWGWSLKFGTQETDFIPDCTGRLHPLLNDLLSETSTIPFGAFMERLATHCPELDGGALFEWCWQASHPNERRGNRLSLMLSTALRVLHQQGQIIMENRADATENWSLFPAQSYMTRVTHIGKGEVQ